MKNRYLIIINTLQEQILKFCYDSSKKKILFSKPQYFE